MAEIRVRGLVDGVKVTTSHVMTLNGAQSMSGNLVLHQTKGASLFLSSHGHLSIFFVIEGN